MIRKTLLTLAGLLHCTLVLAGTPPVISIVDSLIDINKTDTLGLPAANGVRHYTVFKATQHSAQYNHGAVLFAFKGQLYCQWQTSARDEDGPDTHVSYSISADGSVWQPPVTLAPERPDAIVTSGGWWSDNNTLVAFVNVWPKDLSPKAGHVEYALSEDGKHWTEFKPVLNNQGTPIKGIIEQDLKALPSGRVLTAIHHQPGLVATPFYTDDPLAISGWQAADFNNLPFEGDISRELEPSWFLTRNNEAVMVFRDQGSSYKILAARSSDNGQTWSKPAITNIPDSRAKQSAGNLPDGSAYIVNNPTGNKTRMPLIISLSPDGTQFTSAHILRGKDSLPPMLYTGKYKRSGYSYPKSIVWRNALWVSYAINKEDIAVTQLDLAQFNSR